MTIWTKQRFICVPSAVTALLIGLLSEHANEIWCLLRGQKALTVSRDMKGQPGGRWEAVLWQVSVSEIIYNFQMLPRKEKRILKVCINFFFFFSSFVLWHKHIPEFGLDLQ